MKVRRLTSTAPRLQSRRGAISVRDVGDGYVVQKWPRKRGVIHPNQQQGVEAMKRVAWMTLNAAPEEIAAAKEMAAGTGYTWKDQLQAAYWGRAISGVDEDGNIVAPASVYMTTINDLLNTISDEPGAILTRGPTEWVMIPPGAANLVMTWDPDTNLPAWLPAQVSGGAGAASVRMACPSIFANTVSGSAYAIKGSILQATADFYISAVWLPVSPPQTTRVYRAWIAPTTTWANTVQLSAQPVASNPTNWAWPAPNASRFVRCEFPARVPIVAGNDFAILAGMTGVPGTTVLPTISPASIDMVPPPVPGLWRGTGRTTAQPPIAGSMIDTNAQSSAPTPLAIEWSEA